MSVSIMLTLEHASDVTPIWREEFAEIKFTKTFGGGAGWPIWVSDLVDGESCFAIKVAGMGHSEYCKKFSDWATDSNIHILNDDWESADIYYRDEVGLYRDGEGHQLELETYSKIFEAVGATRRDAVILQWGTPNTIAMYNNYNTIMNRVRESVKEESWYFA